MPITTTMRNQLLLAVCFFAGMAIFFSLTVYTVPQGSVAVRFRANALLRGTVEPGLHFHSIPLIDTNKNLDTRVQTDKVTNIPCGTSSGVVIHFENIEVVNQLSPEFVWETTKEFGVNYDRPLIFDVIHHATNEFCSKRTLHQVYVEEFDTIDEYLIATLNNHTKSMAANVKIISVRVTKPKIPVDIAADYERMAQEKVKLMYAVERQKVVITEAETDRKRSRIEAEKAAMVAKIRTDALIVEENSKREISLIRDNTTLARKRAEVDAELYAAKMTAEGNALKLTPEFLELARYQAVSNNTKIYFGDKLPNAAVFWQEREQPPSQSRPWPTEDAQPAQH